VKIKRRYSNQLGQMKPTTTLAIPAQKPAALSLPSSAVEYTVTLTDREVDIITASLLRYEAESVMMAKLHEARGAKKKSDFYSDRAANAIRLMDKLDQLEVDRNE
jgi:hypothetical protein